MLQGQKGAMLQSPLHHTVPLQAPLPHQSSSTNLVLVGLCKHPEDPILLPKPVLADGTLSSQCTLVTPTLEALRMV